MKAGLFLSLALLVAAAASAPGQTRSSVSTTEDPGLPSLDRKLDEVQAKLALRPGDPALALEMALLCAKKAKVLFSEPRGGSAALAYLEDAVDFAGRCLAAEPENSEAHRVRGLAYFRLGEIEKAGKEADWLLAKARDDPAGDILRGEILFKEYLRKRGRGELTKALRFRLTGKIRQHFHRATLLDKKNALPFRRLGDLAVWEGDSRTALDLYAEGLARDPRNGAPLAWILANYAPERSLRMLNRALRRFAELGRLPPERSSSLLWEAGRMAFLAGKDEVCRTHMRKVLVYHPEWTHALFYLGLVEWRQGRPEEATAAFVKIASRRAEDLAEALGKSGEAGTGYAGWISQLASLAAKRGDLASSRDLNHALALFRDTPDDWNNYAFLCRETGRFEESWEAYEAALDLAPSDPNS